MEVPSTGSAYPIIDVEAAKAAAARKAQEYLAAFKPNATVSFPTAGGALDGSGATSATPLALSATPSLAAPKLPISFVIPKNKLSGALVPVGPTGVKWEPVEPPKQEPAKPSRKTAWGADPLDDHVVKKARALAYQTRAEQIAQQLEQGRLEIVEDESLRSPSPEPAYDEHGQRKNTREVRQRESLELERRKAIGDVVQLNPFFKPPSNWKPVQEEAKLYIPQKRYPGFNFIGLILGPRGNTHRRMESESGAKIAIRGKGSQKEGKMYRKDGRPPDGWDDELHVFIQSDTLEKVEKAVAMIEPLLEPQDEIANYHKQKQLRELAIINGLVPANERGCSICGERGHLDFQCPEHATKFQAKVTCGICGDGGHPTVDCPRKKASEPKAGHTMDKEYVSFLEELGDGLGGGGGAVVPGLQEARARVATSEAAAKAAQQGVGIQGVGRPPFRAALGVSPRGPASAMPGLLPTPPTPPQWPVAAAAQPAALQQPAMMAPQPVSWQAPQYLPQTAPQPQQQAPPPQFAPQQAAPQQQFPQRQLQQQQPFHPAGQQYAPPPQQQQQPWHMPGASVQPHGQGLVSTAAASTPAASQPQLPPLPSAPPPPPPMPPTPFEAAPPPPAGPPPGAAPTPPSAASARPSPHDLSDLIRKYGDDPVGTRPASGGAAPPPLPPLPSAPYPGQGPGAAPSFGLAVPGGTVGQAGSVRPGPPSTSPPGPGTQGGPPGFMAGPAQHPAGTAPPPPPAPIPPHTAGYRAGFSGSGTTGSAGPSGAYGPSQGQGWHGPGGAAQGPAPVPPQFNPGSGPRPTGQPQFGAPQPWQQQQVPQAGARPPGALPWQQPPHLGPPQQQRPPQHQYPQQQEQHRQQAPFGLPPPFATQGPPRGAPFNSTMGGPQFQMPRPGGSSMRPDPSGPAPWGQNTRPSGPMQGGGPQQSAARPPFGSPPVPPPPAPPKHDPNLEAEYDSLMADIGII